MRTYKLTISYDGSRYQGWQRQATTDNTIQYILEWSIGKLVGYRVHIDGSGRTDAGVHARGQVASVKLSKLYDTKELKDSLNRYLPEDIRIVKVELAKNGFHARKSTNIKIVSSGEKVRITYYGTGFLYHMVRILTGTLLEIGAGKRDASMLPVVIAAEDRSLAGFLAPARGLFLRKVYY